MKRPKDWRAEVTPIYFEEGQAIGRMIMHDRSKEGYLWSLLGGTGVWPRWYLFAFATLYREAHIKEYNAQKSAKHRRRASKRRRMLRSERSLQQAADKATQPRT